MKILIMGLPGSGKTTFSKKLKSALLLQGKSVKHLNADKVRQLHNDWDFSMEGRIRQANRMLDISNQYDKFVTDFVIADFIAPTEEIRNIFCADVVIFMDTIKQGRYSDTNAVFEPPEKYDIKIVNLDYSIDTILKTLL